MSDIQSGYNQWAAGYDQDENRTRDLDQAVTRRQFENLRFNHILELGCGTGKNTRFFAEIGLAVHALDFSEGMLQKAQQKIKAKHVRFSQTDLTQAWPCENNLYDLISCNLVLEHIENLDWIFKQASKVITQNGYFFISELHPFKQYLGSKARFQNGEIIQEIPAYIHHISHFIESARQHGLKLETLTEHWHALDENSPPRLINFIFRS